MVATRVVRLTALILASNVLENHFSDSRKTKQGKQMPIVLIFCPFVAILALARLPVLRTDVKFVCYCASAIHCFLFKYTFLYKKNEHLLLLNVRIV